MANDSGAPAPVAGPPAVAPTQGTFNAGTNEPKVHPGASASAPAAPAAAPAPVAPPAAPVSLVVGDAPAAPAADLTLAETPAAVPAAPAKVVPVAYESTGNAALDISLAFLGKLGIDPDHPGMKAAAAGDFGILKATLATMGDKAQGWEANIALGEKALTERNAAEASRKAADQKAIIDTAGGVEQWEAIRKFAADATADSPAERVQVNAALSGGGLAAKAMVAYLKTLAEQHAAVKVPASVVQPGAASQVGNTSAALSPREYAAEVAKLNTKLRGRLDNSPEYAALKSRRAMWRGERR